MIGLLRWIDQFRLDDPDNNEGFTGDICTVCDRRIVDHPGRERDGIGNQSARWPHRWAALATILTRS